MEDYTRKSKSPAHLGQGDWSGFESNDKYDMDQNLITNYQLKKKLHDEEQQREQSKLTEQIANGLQGEQGQWKSQWLQRLAQEKVAKAERIARQKQEQEENLRKLLWQWDD